MPNSLRLAAPDILPEYFAFRLAASHFGSTWSKDFDGNDRCLMGEPLERVGQEWKQGSCRGDRDQDVAWLLSRYAFGDRTCGSSGNDTWLPRVRVGLYFSVDLW